MKILVAKISPNPQQPRKHFDEEYIQGLAQSIKSIGLQSPILVEDNGKGNFTLVSGECRWRAHKLLNRKYIEASVREPTNHSGKQRLTDAMVENVQRENMNPVDEAHGYRAMYQDHGMSIKQISMAVGKTETYIRSLLPITEMHPEIQQLIAEGRLPRQREALEALSSIPDEPTRLLMARKCAERGLGVRMIVKQCARFVEIKKQVRKTKLKRPALEISGLTEEPTDWDALYQVGRVPPWQKFTEAVMDVCDNCSLRPVASEETCGQCPLVDMCRRMMEKVK